MVYSISPIDVEHPCGADLEYDPAFVALQQAATTGREQQFGDTLIPAVAPDWRQVAAQAIELLGRTLDVRLFALLTLAWTETEGFEGYARGLTLTANALDQYWEHVHPQLQAAGEFDPLPRLNALAALTDREALGRAARGATLLHWRFGQLSLRDAAAILEGRPASAAMLDSSSSASLQAELRAALRGAPREVAVAQHVLDAIERIARQISENLDDSWVPDPSSVENPLRAVLQAAGEQGRGQRNEHEQANNPPVAQRQESIPSPIDLQTPASAGHVAGLLPEPSGTPIPIRSRDDVLRALNHACLYLERAEPGHPVPLLLRRAQRLMHMNFYEIVRDMAPAALPQLDALTGGESHRPASHPDS